MRADEVHLWKLDLDVPTDMTALSEAERRRFARIVGDPARTRAATARVLLRRVLARYAGVAAEELRFAEGAHGKPYLAGAGFHFNLAHSDGLGVVAVALAEVGVDVERRRSVPDAAALAARFFAPDEADALAALPEPARDDAFLRLWTRKEAVLKARGCGLAGGLAAAPTGAVSFDCGRDYVGAVAPPLRVARYALS